MENEILNIAVEKINNLTGVSCKILDEKIHYGNKIMDAKIGIEHHNKEIRYFVETKKKIVPEQIPGIIEQTKGMRLIMLMADYITPKAKELLRLKNIPYADTSGNMYLTNQNLYIYIQTAQSNRQKLKTNTSAFNKAGLKVLFQFLIHPEYLNKPYRFIGEKAGVTIATVGNVIHDLLREKFIVKTNNKRYRFINRQQLFKEWVRAYNKNLRPKLKQQRYRWLEKKVKWKNIRLPNDTFWGGVNASEILTEYIIADQLQIYTGLPFKEVMKILKIIPDEKGETTLMEKFWKNGQETNNLINPMLIYADLLFDTNPRNIEVADKIYKQYVKDKL